MARELKEQDRKWAKLVKCRKGSCYHHDHIRASEREEVLQDAADQNGYYVDDGEPAFMESVESYLAFQCDESVFHDGHYKSVSKYYKYSVVENEAQSGVLTERNAMIVAFIEVLKNDFGLETFIEPCVVTEKIENMSDGEHRVAKPPWYPGELTAKLINAWLTLPCIRSTSRIEDDSTDAATALEQETEVPVAQMTEAQHSTFKRAMKLLQLKPCVLPARYGTILRSLAAKTGDELAAKQAEQVASGQASRWNEEASAITARMNEYKKSVCPEYLHLSAKYDDFDAPSDDEDDEDGEDDFYDSEDDSEDYDDDENSEDEEDYNSLDEKY